MSPAPQANPEVEKYIGSYLISQRIPPNVKSPSAKRFQNQPGKQKSPDGEKVRFNKHCFPHRDHVRYPAPPGLRGPLPVDYGGSHYEHPGGGWAGVPLISMTSGNHRRNKKVPPSGSPGQQKYSQKTQQNGYAKGKEDEESRGDSDRSPLTRLAIHTQGAPLIQAGRYSGNRCKNGFNRDQNRAFRGDGARWEPAKETKAQAGAQNQTRACGGGGGVDSVSVASDESSGNSENSLPRIIKPRKRRKKDRKPLTGPGPVSAVPQAEPAAYGGPGDQEQKPESALKPYFDCASDSGENRSTTDLLSENAIVLSASDDLIDTFTSDEFPFGNLLDDEEDKDSESPSATLCQCRYCDPSGVIWDVDQRCYSPFLTPPSPTVNPYGRYFDTDLNTLLRRSWSDPSSYGKPEKSRAAPSDGRPSSLQVSSEIVTSPNGHRDIEIKFYSSPPPPQQEEPLVAAGGRARGHGERCFVAEE